MWLIYSGGVAAPQRLKAGQHMAQMCWMPSFPHSLSTFPFSFKPLFVVEERGGCVCVCVCVGYGSLLPYYARCLCLFYFSISVKKQLFGNFLNHFCFQLKKWIIL